MSPVSGNRRRVITDEVAGFLDHLALQKGQRITKAVLVSSEELHALDNTACGLWCGGCDTFLATEGDFARHFTVPDRRFPNLGYCPVEGPTAPPRSR